MMFAGCVSAGMGGRASVSREPEAKLLFERPSPRPEWTFEIDPEAIAGKVVFAGASQNAGDEQAARNEAEEQALAAFARYCGVDAAFVQENLTVHQTNERGVVESARTGVDAARVESEVSARRAYIDKTYMAKYAAKRGPSAGPRVYFKYWVLLAIPREEYRRIIRLKEEAEQEQEVRSVVEYVPAEGAEWIKETGVEDDDEYVYRGERAEFAEGRHLETRALLESRLKQRLCDFIGVTASDPGDYYVNPGIEFDRGFAKITSRVAGRMAPRKAFESGEYHLRARIAKARIAEIRAALDGLRKEARPIRSEIGFYRDAYVRGKREKIWLMDGDEVKSGDQLKVSIQVNQPAHVYIFNIDSKGTINVLFPSPKISLANPIPANYRVDIPPDVEFRLDQNAGEELFYVFMTRNESADLKALAASPQARELLSAAETRYPPSTPAGDHVMRKLRLKHVQ